MRSLLTLTFLLATISLQAEMRTFTSKTGSQLKAEVVSVDSATVVLKKADGSTMNVPISALSDSDVSYLQSLKPAAQNGEAEPSESAALRTELDFMYPIDEDMRSKDAEEVFDDAYDAYAKKNYEKAIQLWASIPSKHDEYADARRRAGYNALGRELGRWNEALLFLQDAYAAAPRNKDVLEDLGRAYVELDRIDEAIPILKKANTRKAREVLREFD